MQSKPLLFVTSTLARGNLFYRLTMALRAFYAIIRGQYETVGDGVSIYTDDHVHSLEQSNLSLQHELMRKTDSSEAMRRKLRSERTVALEVYSCCQNLIDAWQEDAYPAGESLVLAFGELAERIEEVRGYVKLVPYHTWQQLRKINVDKHDKYDIVADLVRNKEQNNE